MVTGAFVMASVGAFYLLTRQHEEYGRTFVRLGVIAGSRWPLLMLFPTGDGQGKLIARAPAGDAGGHGRAVRDHAGARRSPSWASRTSRKGSSTTRSRCRACSASSPTSAGRREVQGPGRVPRDDWPDNIPLLYYSYHIMVGLGTIFIAVHGGLGLAAVARPAVRVAGGCCGS